MSRAGEIRKSLRSYYAKHFAECSASIDEPCGYERLRLAGGELRPPSYPAVGGQYGIDPKVRKIVFVGKGPSRRGLDHTPDHTRELFEKCFDRGFDDDAESWEDEGFRASLKRMASIATGKPQTEALSYAAWLNVVKCGSAVKRSAEPTWRMWLHCAPRVWGELEILEPDLVIALGADVHDKLTEGAAHRAGEAQGSDKAPVDVPQSPWPAFWSDITVAGKRVGFFCAFHPSDVGRAVDTAVAAINKGRVAPGRLGKFFALVAGAQRDARPWIRDALQARGARPPSRLSVQDVLTAHESYFISPSGWPVPRLAF